MDLNSQQQMPPCFKMFTVSWVRKGLSNVRVHISLDTLHGVAVSAALAAGVSLAPILQASERP